MSGSLVSPRFANPAAPLGIMFRPFGWFEAVWLMLYPEGENLRRALLPHLNVED